MVKFLTVSIINQSNEICRILINLLRGRNSNLFLQNRKIVFTIGKSFTFANLAIELKIECRFYQYSNHKRYCCDINKIDSTVKLNRLRKNKDSINYCVHNCGKTAGVLQPVVVVRSERQRLNRSLSIEQQLVRLHIMSRKSQYL